MALTAHASAVRREQALAAGCVGFITKPIDVRTMAHQLRDILYLRPLESRMLAE